jgi:hypothetical protein
MRGITSAPFIVFHPSDQDKSKARVEMEISPKGIMEQIISFWCS